MEDNEDPFIEFIRNLVIDLPEKGLDAPEVELINDDTEEIDGNVLKITFNLHMFMNHRKDRYFMLTSDQQMQMLGKMTLREALVKFNAKRRPRKKG